VSAYRAFQVSASQPSGLRPRLSAGVSFWVMIVAYLGLMFAASAPSPLYVVYEARWHFSAITLTSIFGVYALALLLTLLTVGGLSDFIGRKPVLLAGFALLAASMVVFARADGVGWLYLARVLQGLAAGSTLGALSAGIIDFAGPARQRFAGLVNSLVPALGLALGALGAGGLVQFAPAPTVLVFVVLGVLFAMVLVAVAAGPETGRRRDGALRSLTPRMGVPRRLFRTRPALFATWAQVGLTLSLTTTLAAARFGLTDRFLDALVVGVVCGSASVATVVMRNASPQRGTVLGCAALVTGTAITLVSLVGPWTIAFYVGATATGLGLGSTMGAAMRSLSALPAHSERGEFFASVYVVGYLAFSVPAIVAGIAVVHAGIVETTVGYGLGISLLALVAGVNALRPARELAAEFAPKLASEESSPTPVGASA